MREIQVSQITETVKKLCIEANHFLSKDMEDALISAQQAEESELGKKIFGQLFGDMKTSVGPMLS